MTRIVHRLFLWKWILCQAVTSVLCLLFHPKTVHWSTKNVYTSEITFLVLVPWAASTIVAPASHPGGTVQIRTANVGPARIQMYTGCAWYIFIYMYISSLILNKPIEWLETTGIFWACFKYIKLLTKTLDFQA